MCRPHCRPPRRRSVVRHAVPSRLPGIPGAARNADRQPAAGTTWTADVGIPLALAVGGATGTQIIPFVTPSFALIATSSAGGDIRAGRGLIGAGVSLFNAKSMLAASAGFQYVFVSNTELQFGIALSLGGR